jgi:hypothetical protein
MGITTNMSIPYPESSDYVADGATDMQNIATVIDGKTGLIATNHQAFTGVSSLTIDGCFNGNLRNYRLIMNVFGSVNAASVSFNFRSGGTTDPSSNYNRLGYYYIGGSFTDFSATGYASAYMVAWSNTAYSPISMDIFTPQEATTTRILHNAQQSDTNLIFNIAQYVSTSTSYDGITMSVSSGTMSGHIGIYGYLGT